MINRRSKRIGAVCFLLAALMLLSFCCAPRAGAVSEAELYENAVLFWINTERARYGLSPLLTTDALNRAAGIRASEIPRSFSHVRPDGRAIDTVLDECGIPAYYVGENIGGGYADPCAAVRAWMESSGHRDNILNPQFSYIGNGYYYADSTTYKRHWSQLFVGMTEYPGAKSSFYVAPTGLTLSRSELSLSVGQTAGILAGIEPAYATEAITCVSSDSSVLEVTVIEVNAIGIKGVSDGTATLRIACGDIVRSVTVTVGSGTAALQNSSDPSVSFRDVPASSPFYSAISRAAKNGIVSGYSDGSFRPDGACTRAHVLTFLWRASNCPEPESSINPFTDVAASSPFYKAILWGYHEGITSGITATEFCPDDICTRAQVVTFLWRYYGRPAGGKGVYFADMLRLNSDFTSAIGWAAAEGIAAGYSDGSFRPYGTCTRAHVVSFLYRSFKQ